MPRKRSGDPLINALLGKLPPAGSDWPTDRRAAWLRLLEEAFNVIYGGPAGGGMTSDAMPAELNGVHGMNGNGGTPPKPDHAGYDYYIDSNGFARCDVEKDDNGLPRPTPGRRIMPDELEPDEAVYDYRRGAARVSDHIIWADDSMRAVPGMSLCGPG